MASIIYQALDAGDRRAPRRQGRPVQVEPMQPMLKAPGIKRLNLNYDGPLSNFSFKFYLRHYNKETSREVALWSWAARREGGGHALDSPADLLRYMV